MNRRRVFALALALPLLAGCAGGLFRTVGPNYTAPAPPVPENWQSPLPEPSARAHGGSPERLADWWSQFNDPTLDTLITAAQHVSSTVAQAAATIERSRADAIAAGFAASPGVQGTAGASRSVLAMGGPAIHQTQFQIGAQSSWEIDLFGGLARQRESTRALVEANVSLWHDARVSVAAEIANAYINLRFCEMQVALADADARSRADTARIIEIAGRAGLQASAAVALAQAAAAEAAATLAQRRSQCDIAVKGLVALTAIDEPALRAMLARSGTAKMPVPAHFRIDSMPARVIAQRPDVSAAERRLAAASADIGQAEAERYPRLTLAGNITPTRISASGPGLSVTTWSIGPTLTFPLVDGGRRRANVEAFRAQYTAAESAYRARVRAAVREVEEALVRLASATEREADTVASARGYRTSLEAAQAKLQVGLGSVLELEEARRFSLAADAAVTALAQERLAAWVALYRAVGGGWDAEPPPRR